MRNNKENPETSIWISTTDLMSGLLVIFLFISIVSSAVCLTVNLMTSFLPFWSLIVIIGIVYCWVLIVHTILSRRSIFEKIFQI